MPDWPKRGEVWWVSFDPSIGGEIQKTRPAVVVSNNQANRTLNRIQVVPLTSNVARIYPGTALVQINGRAGKAVADQLFTAARERFGRRLGVLSPEDVREVDDAIRTQLAL